MLQAIRRYDKALVFLLIVNILFTTMGSFVPVVMPKLIIDELTGAGSPVYVIGLSVAFGLLLLIANGVSQCADISISGRFIAVRLRLIAQSGAKFMGMDFQNLEDPKVLDLSQKADRATNNNNEGLEGIMHRVQWGAGRLVTLLSVAAVIATLNPLLLLAFGALLLVNFAASTYTRKKDKKVWDELAPVNRKLWYLEQTAKDFSYGKDVRLFAMREFLHGRLEGEQRRQFMSFVRLWKLWLHNGNLMAATSLLQEVLLYAWLCWKMLDGAIGIGDFTMYAAAIRTFSSAMGGLLDDISAVRQQNEVVCDFREFLAYPDRTQGSLPVPDSAMSDGLCFTFEHVSFRYPGQEAYALRDVSFTIRPGERLAVVGLNGAGKTTFIKLLMRLYEPTQGRILLNGVDVASYDKASYYRLFSAVFQDIQMFAFTVAENVSMQAYAATDMDRVHASLDKAGLADKIAALPQGIDQTVLKVIDEGGVEFSGGESQKLALARALYKNAPVIVLDEPTAALDALAEERLYRQFDSLTRGKSAVYISHRLASTQFCDRIALFEDGRICAIGSHQELMEKEGRYAEIFRMQARYYKEEAAV